MSFDLRKSAIQFLKFGIVGLSNTIISYAVYSLLVYFEFYYIIASIVAFVISVLNSFFWNNKYVFKKEKKHRRNFLLALLKTYISYAFTGLILQNAVLYFFIDILYFSKYLAPLFGLAITIPLNFILNKFWAFKFEKLDKDVQNNEEDQHFDTLLQ